MAYISPASEGEATSLYRLCRKFVATAFEAGIEEKEACAADGWRSYHRFAAVGFQKAACAMA